MKETGRKKNKFRPNKQTVSVNSRFRQRAAMAERMDKSGYPAYLWSFVKDHSLYRILKKYVDYFRRLRLIAFLLKAVNILFLLFETGTLFILFLCLALLALPFVGILIFLYYIISLLCLPRDRHVLRQKIHEKKIYVFFISRQDLFSRGNFSRENILSFAENGTNAVLVISPFIFSGQGLTPNSKFYLNMRQEKNGIWLMRRHCFFAVRSHILKNISRHVVLIY